MDAHTLPSYAGDAVEDADAGRHGQHRNLTSSQKVADSCRCRVAQGWLDGRLITFDAPQVFHRLFMQSRAAAGLERSHLHRLRHGGASADALLQSLTDLDIATRGRWASLKSVARYRRPARYLRALESLPQGSIRRAKEAEEWLTAHLATLIESPTARKRFRPP